MRLFRCSGIVCLLAVMAHGWQETNPAAPIDPRVDQVLTDLQKRSDGLRDIRCEVRFVDDDRINLSKRTKVGTILFLLTEPNPRFLIHFTKTIVDDVVGQQEWYLFDGRWLYEAIERIKQVTKREVAREGERVDLFDLETAPFPLPFGQKKETIVRNFEVSLVPPQAGDPAGTAHLVCVPKPDSRMYQNYEKLEFFVQEDIDLPRRIVVTRNKGLEIQTADFPDISADSINTGVEEEDFTKPKAWKDYKVVVEKLRPEGDAP